MQLYSGHLAGLGVGGSGANEPADENEENIKQATKRAKNFFMIWKKENKIISLLNTHFLSL